MENCKTIIFLFEEEIKRVNNCSNLDELLEICQLSKAKFVQINEDFNKYLVEIEKKEMEFGEIVKITNETAVAIRKKSQQIFSEKTKMITDEIAKSSIKNADNDLETTDEEKALEKAKLNLKYLEKNQLVVTVLEVLKSMNEEIEKITNMHAQAVCDIQLCQNNLQMKEIKMKEIERQKLEEEVARKEIERLETERIKQEAKDAELRLKEIERMKLILEEEAKNKGLDKSENFETFRFDVANGEFGVFGIGCFLRTLKENMGSKDDLIVELIDLLSVKCEFDATDEIVSNIIEIRTTMKTEESIQFEKAFSIILPHSMARTQARETKIYKYDKGEEKWFSLETQDITMEEIDKSGARFVEAIFDELPLLVTVVSVPKVEEVEYGKKGNNWSASVDSRVNVLIPSNSVKVNQKMKITTLAFDSNFTQDVKAKSKGTAVDNIYTFTHLLKIDSPKKRLLKPGLISLPLAQKQPTKSDNIAVPMPALVSNADTRPKASFGTSTMCDLEDEVRLLSMDVSKQWQQNNDFVFEIDKKKDCIKFEIPELKDMTFLGVRVKPEASPEQINKGVSIIMEHFKLRQIKIIITNNIEDLNFFTVIVCPVSRIDKQMLTLEEEGFNSKKPLLSQEIEIKEREILSLRLRGNIKVEGKEEDFKYKFMYCSQLKNQIKLRLEVVDKYAQRVKTTYQGFLTVTMSTWLKKPQPKVEGQTRKGPPIMLDIEEVIPLYEALLCIPKISDTPNIITMKDKPFNFVSKDNIDSEFLRKLSSKIKNDWKPLAKALELSNNRIEEISCLIVDKDKNELAYEVLKVWILNLPVCKNKELIIRKALISINREDLIEKLFQT